MVYNVEYPESHRGKRVINKQINRHWQRERRRERGKDRSQTSLQEYTENTQLLKRDKWELFFVSATQEQEFNRANWCNRDKKIAKRYLPIGGEKREQKYTGRTNKNLN